MSTNDSTGLLFNNIAGNLVIPQGFNFKNASGSIFAFTCNLDACTRVCDDWLNSNLTQAEDVEDGETYYRYVPLAPMVYVGFFDYPLGHSINVKSLYKGNMPYQESWVAIGMAKLKYTKGIDEAEFATMGFFFPYLWMDSPLPMIAGREIFGFNKTIGELKFDSSSDSPDFLGVQAISFRDPSPDTASEQQNLIRITKKSEGENKKVVDPALMTQLFIKTLTGQEPGQPYTIPNTNVTIDPENLFTEAQFPIVCLKQLRDHANPDMANYRKIIETFCVGVSINSFNWLEDKYELSLERNTLFPIGEMFGMASSQPAIFSYQCGMSFDLIFGREVD